MKRVIYLIKENKWLLLILVVATFLRFFHLDFQSLWMDEIYTMNISNPKLTFSEFHSEMILREGFPYLYFILLKIAYIFFGYTSFVARAFSAFIGVLSVYVIYRFGKELIHKKAGLFAAVLLALNEYNIYISQDARPYSLYFLVTITSFFSLVKLLKNATYKNSIIYGLSAGLLLNVNFFGFVNILSQIAIILFYFVLTPNEYKWKKFKLYAISGLIALVLFIPNYEMLIKLLNFKSFWIPVPTQDSFSLLFKEFLGNSEMTLFIFYPIFIFYFMKLFNLKDEFKLENIMNNKLHFSFILFFGWFSIFIFFMMAKSYLDISLILTRYFTSIIPVFFLVLGIGIYLVKSKLIRGVLILSIIVFSLANLTIVKNYYYGINKAQFREASKFVILNNKNDEPVYTSQKYWFDYYFNDSKTKLQEIELETMFQEMVKDSTKIKPFWYVDAFGKTFTVSDETQKFINSNFYIENNYDGFQAWTKHFILLKDVAKEIDISKFENLKQNNGDAIMQNVETFEHLNNVVKTSGWAYFENQDSSETQIEILILKEDKAFRLMTQKVLRPDVTTYFKCDFDANNSGFSSTIDISDFESGKYQLAIYLINKETKKEGVYLTEKFIEK